MFLNRFKKQIETALGYIKPSILLSIYHDIAELHSCMNTIIIYANRMRQLHDLKSMLYVSVPVFSI